MCGRARIGCAWAGLDLLLAGPAVAADQPVDLELVLAVDVSGSMDPDEQALQRRGYVQALEAPDVIEAIRTGVYGRIALAYLEWGGPLSQRVTIPWTLIDGPAAAETFASALAEAPPARFHGTSISGALAYAAGMFDGNGFAGLRRAIDVSGDGPNNSGRPLEPIRDGVVAAGIAINGLPLQLDPPYYLVVGGPTLVAYYRDCVIGGPGAFVLPVDATEQIPESIRRKLVQEIAGAAARVVPAAAPPPDAKVDCLLGERQRRDWEQEP